MGKNQGSSPQVTQAGTRVLDLVEYQSESFGREQIAEEDARLIWKTYSDKVEIEGPSFKTEDRWRVTPQGWVGFLPISDRLALSLRPKVPIHNLFRMFEFAYELQSLEFLEGVFETGSLQEFYERLAGLLARRVLERGRRGLHRSYVPAKDQLPFVRGSIDIQDRIRRPWATAITCDFEEHTSDIEDNRILAWTLYGIGRSGLCTQRTLPSVRYAYHVLVGAASLVPYGAADCVRRRYHRLNDDYRGLHALCRFFLEHSGPKHEHGGHKAVPFLVNMARLYELFVSEWLKAHLRPEYVLQTQGTFGIAGSDTLRFQIDMIIRERTTGRPVLVLDAKYKASDSPSADDVAQITAYAELLGCPRAALVYPKAIARELSGRIGDIELRTLSFGLSGDLETGGSALLESISEWGLK